MAAHSAVMKGCHEAVLESSIGPNPDLATEAEDSINKTKVWV
jgi:hypothetical protein